MLSTIVQKSRTVLRHFLYRYYPESLHGKIVSREQMKFIMVNPNETIQKNLFLYGQFERFTSELATDLLLKGQKKGSVLDIGSNLGSFAIPLANVVRNSDIRIYCFECQPAVYQQLCANIFVNGCSGSIRAEPSPVSDSVMKIDVPMFSLSCEDFVGSVSLNKDVIRKRTETEGIAEPCDGSYRSEQLITTTVDLYCADIAVAFMKIDVEGMEAEVLLGAAETIARDRPYILGESWGGNAFRDLRERLNSILASYNYEVLHHQDDFLAVPQEDLNEDLIWMAKERGFIALDE